MPTLEGDPHSAFQREPTDSIRLATKVTRSTPVYLSQEADVRQSMGQLLSWFPTSNDRTIYIIIRRQEPQPEVEEPEEPEEQETSGKGKGKKKGKGRGKGRPSIAKKEVEVGPEPEEEDIDEALLNAELDELEAGWDRWETEFPTNEPRTIGITSRKRSASDLQPRTRQQRRLADGS
jgi:hypothetical protein